MKKINSIYGLILMAIGFTSAYTEGCYGYGTGSGYFGFITPLLIITILILVGIIVYNKIDKTNISKIKK